MSAQEEKALQKESLIFYELKTFHREYGQEQRIISNSTIVDRFHSMPKLDQDSADDIENDHDHEKNFLSPSSAFALTETKQHSSTSPVPHPSTLTPPPPEPEEDHDKFITEIMSLLNQEKLEELKRAFEQNDDEGLELKEFIHVMANIMRMDENLYTQEQFAANLIEFFDQVDINGDGSMEWEGERASLAVSEASQQHHTLVVTSEL